MRGIVKHKNTIILYFKEIKNKRLQLSERKPVKIKGLNETVALKVKIIT